MVISDYEIVLNGRSDSIKLYAMGDFHLGAKGHDSWRFKRDIKRIEEDPSAYWIGLGDYIDAIEKRDEKRFAPSDINPDLYPHLDILPQIERDMLIEQIRPIANKCLGLIRGNHEGQYQKRHSFDVIRDVCQILSIPDLSDMAFVRLKLIRKTEAAKQPNRTVLILATHGSGGGVTKGAKVNKIDRIMSHHDADLYLMGHVHDGNATRTCKLQCTVKGDGHMVERPGGGMIGKTYLRTYQEGATSYGQLNHYPAAPLGCVYATIWPFLTMQTEHGQVETMEMELTI